VQIYLHADLAIKEKALALAAPPGVSPVATDRRTRSRVPVVSVIMPNRPATSAFETGSPLVLGIIRYSA